MLPFAILAIFSLSVILMMPDDEIDDTSDPINTDVPDVQPVDDLLVDSDTRDDGDESDPDVVVEETTADLIGTDDDDVLVGEQDTGDIFGGDGNDDITGITASAEPVTLFGGAGDDTIDGRLMDNGALFGGDGDDTIYTSNQASGGTGYNLSSSGDAGNDTLVHDAPPQIPDGILTRLTGGEGNDRFEISFDESIAVLLDDLVEEYSPFDEPPAQSSVVTITDFDPDEDTLQITLDIADETYQPTTATLEEVPYEVFDTETQTLLTRGATHINVNFESDTLPDREITVIVQTPDLNWDDVTFAGDVQPATLVPLI